MKKHLGSFLLIILIISVIGVSCSTPSQTETSSETGEPSGSSDAGKFPEKSIQVIISFSPGGETDVVGRLVMSYVQQELGQNMVVINKPGASGEVGWGELAQAANDGYTIGMVNPPTFVQIPIKKGDGAAYKLDHFEPIANVSTDPGAIVVMKDYPANDLKELVELAKESPGTITVATSGAGTSEAIALTRIQEATEASFNEVPFEGTANMSAALQGGHVDVAIMNVSSALNLVDSGSVKVLGVGSLERDEHMPDTPTYIEQGIDVEQFSMRGFVAPKGTDPAIIEMIDAAIAKVFQNEEFLQKAADSNLLLEYLDHKQFKETLEYLDKSNREVWEKYPW